jgi:quinoprotein relay system zinc metallohydrolase 2
MHALVRKRPLGRARRFIGALLAAAAVSVQAVAPLPVTEAAPGVYLFQGEVAEPDARNQGAVSNLGFIVGSQCVAVVDTGGSPAVGAALRASIRGKTRLPICYVINTHVHPDHLFGNQAFVDDQPVFIGHARLPAALAARGRHYVAAAERLMGAAGQGLQVVPPSRTVQGEEVIDLGGRTLRLRAWPTAHTDNDLTVLDETSGTLFAGDLLFVDHMPVVDGKIIGWIRLTETLASMAVRRVVPGHGDVGTAWRDALAKQGNYLRALVDQTRVALKAGRTLAQAVEQVGQAEAAHWALSESFHRRNVTATFAELEWED